MAQNPDGSRPNRNTLYIGGSGAGKSQALKQNPEIPKRGVRVLLYDPNEDHRARRYQSKAQFGRAVLREIKRGGGFRIAYCGGDSEADHEWFCDFVWQLLDGGIETYVIDEELGGSGQRSGAAAPKHARLMNQGRKYGMVYHGVVQFPTEVPKTVYRNCPVKYCGRQDDIEIAKKLAPMMGLQAEHIYDQPELHFYVRDPSQGRDATPKQFQYKKI